MIFDLVCLAIILSGIGTGAVVDHFLEQATAQDRDSGCPCDRREAATVTMLRPVYDQDADQP